MSQQPEQQTITGQQELLLLGNPEEGSPRLQQVGSASSHLDLAMDRPTSSLRRTYVLSPAEADSLSQAQPPEAKQTKSRPTPAPRLSPPGKQWTIPAAKRDSPTYSLFGEDALSHSFRPIDPAGQEGVPRPHLDTPVGRHVNAQRGGRVPFGFTQDETGYTELLQMGGPGRPIGAAAQMAYPLPRRLDFQEPGEPEGLSYQRIGEACRSTCSPTRQLVQPDEAELLGTVLKNMARMEGAYDARFQTLETRLTRSETAHMQAEASRRLTEYALRQEQEARQQEQTLIQELTGQLQHQEQLIRQLEAQLSSAQTKLSLLDNGHDNLHQRSAHQQERQQQHEERLDNLDKWTHQGENRLRTIESLSDLLGHVDERLTAMQEAQDSIPMPPKFTFTPRGEEPSEPPPTLSRIGATYNLPPDPPIPSSSECGANEPGMPVQTGSQPSSQLPADQTGCPTMEGSYLVGRAPRVKPDRPVPNLPSFYGKAGDSLRSFLTRMEISRKVGHWTDEHMHGQVMLCLKGAAFQYVTSLPEEQYTTWAQLQEVLIRKYEGKFARQDAKDRLQVVKRLDKESAEALGQRVKELARVAYPGNQESQDSEGVCAFRKALNQRTLSDTIIAQRCQTVDDCVDRVTELERTWEMDGRAKPVIRIRQIQEEEPKDPKPPKKNKGIQKAKAKVVPPPPKPGSTIPPLMANPMVPPSHAFPPMSREELERFQRNVEYMRWNDKRNREYGFGPSEIRPCATCGSPTHWREDCPQKGAPQGPNRRQGNERGLDPRSKGQSQA